MSPVCAETVYAPSWGYGGGPWGFSQAMHCRESTVYSSQVVSESSLPCWYASQGTSLPCLWQELCYAYGHSVSVALLPAGRHLNQLLSITQCYKCSQHSNMIAVGKTPLLDLTHRHVEQLFSWTGTKISADWQTVGSLALLTVFSAVFPANESLMVACTVVQMPCCSSCRLQIERIEVLRNQRQQWWQWWGSCGIWLDYN